MRKSDPKHFMTIDGNKFRKNQVRWALAILRHDSDWCPKTQAVLGQLGGGSWIDESLIPESIVKAGYVGNGRYFTRPFTDEAEKGVKRTKRKNDFLLLFNVLKDRRRKKSERLNRKHRTDQDDAR